MVQLGSFGVLVALIWHIVKVQIPLQDKRSDDRQTAFLAAIDKVHADCAKEREAMMTAFENQTALQREHDRRETQRLTQAFERRRDREPADGA